MKREQDRFSLAAIIKTSCESSKINKQRITSKLTKSLCSLNDIAVGLLSYASSIKEEEEEEGGEEENEQCGKLHCLI